MLKLQINLWEAIPNAEVYIATPEEIKKKGSRLGTVMQILTIPYFIFVIFIGIKIGHVMFASIVGGIIFFGFLIIFGLFLQPKKYREVLARIEYPDDDTFIFTSKKYPEPKKYNAHEYNKLKSTSVGNGIQIALSSKDEEIPLGALTLLDDMFDQDAIIGIDPGERYMRERVYPVDEALSVLCGLTLIRDGKTIDLTEAKEDVYNKVSRSAKGMFVKK